MSENKSSYLIETTDPLGNIVYLSEDKWAYLTDKHPELHGELTEIESTIVTPDTIYKDKDYQHNYCYYRQHSNTALRIYGTQIKVVVDYDTQGSVKTAYVTNRNKEQTELVYNKHKKTKKSK